MGAVIPQMTRPAVIKEWPLYMALPNAARCCDMTPTQFLQAVACADLPQPVIINGQERWRLTDIENMGQGTGMVKPWRKFA